MSTDPGKIWTLLREAGVVAGSAPAASGPETPWYVRLMLGFAGWLAALFLLGFVAVALAWVVESGTASIVVGLAMISGCWMMQRRWESNAFASQAALAASFCGQALFAFGLFRVLDAGAGDTPPWVIFGGLQAALALVMPSVFHRLWSAYLAATCGYVALFTLGAGFAAAPLLLALIAWLWLNAWSWPGRIQQLRPVAYGLSLALVGMVNTAEAERSLAGLVGRAGQLPLLPPWTGELLLGAVFLTVVWTLLGRWQTRLPGRPAVAALLTSLLLVAVSLQVPGITIGVALLLLGFANGNRLLAGLGIFALLGYASSYYYLLDATLAVKAGWLALIGTVVLAGRWLVLRALGTSPDHPVESRHA